MSFIQLSWVDAHRSVATIRRDCVGRHSKCLYP